MTEKIFTLDELKNYDGKEGRKAYIAVDGVVYDVTNVYIIINMIFSIGKRLNFLLVILYFF